MKNYTLEAIIKGQTIKFDKKFNSRLNALNFAFKYCNKHYLYNLEIEDEYLLGNKHSVEYVLNNYDRFVVIRA